MLIFLEPGRGEFVYLNWKPPSVTNRTNDHAPAFTASSTLLT